jgi:hypothetical protein
MEADTVQYMEMGPVMAYLAKQPHTQRCAKGSNHREKNLVFSVTSL